MSAAASNSSLRMESGAETGTARGGPSISRAGAGGGGVADRDRVEKCARMETKLTLMRKVYRTEVRVEVVRMGPDQIRTARRELRKGRRSNERRGHKGRDGERRRDEGGDAHKQRAGGDAQGAKDGKSGGGKSGKRTHKDGGEKTADAHREKLSSSKRPKLEEVDFLSSPHKPPFPPKSRPSIAPTSSAKVKDANSRKETSKSSGTSAAAPGSSSSTKSPAILSLSKALSSPSPSKSEKFSPSNASSLLVPKLSSTSSGGKPSSSSTKPSKSSTTSSKLSSKSSSSSSKSPSSSSKSPSSSSKSSSSSSKSSSSFKSSGSSKSSISSSRPSTSSTSSLNAEKEKKKSTAEKKSSTSNDKEVEPKEKTKAGYNFSYVKKTDADKGEVFKRPLPVGKSNKILTSNVEHRRELEKKNKLLRESVVKGRSLEEKNKKLVERTRLLELELASCKDSLAKKSAACEKATAELKSVALHNRVDERQVEAAKPQTFPFLCPFCDAFDGAGELQRTAVAAHIAVRHAAFLLDLSLLEEEEGEDEVGSGAVAAGASRRKRTCQECGRSFDATRSYMLCHVMYSHREVFGDKLRRLPADLSKRLNLQQSDFVPLCKDRMGVGNVLFADLTVECLRCQRRFCRKIDFDLHLALEHYLDQLVPKRGWVEDMLCDNRAKVKKEPSAAEVTVKKEPGEDKMGAAAHATYGLDYKCSWPGCKLRFRSRTGQVGHMVLAHDVMADYFGTVFHNDYVRILK